MQIKSCPVCNMKNSVATVVCSQCGTNISAVEPIEEVVKTEVQTEVKKCVTCGAENNSAEPICKVCMGQNFTTEKSKELGKEKVKLYLIIDKLKVEISSGNILGREAIGKEYLGKIETVSRNHARFTYEENQWFLEDLNSTNGTYINNRKIEKEVREKISNGDKIGFSKGFTGICEIE